MKEFTCYSLMATDDRFDEKEMIEDKNGVYMLREEVQPIIDGYNKLVTKLLSFKDEVRDYIKGLVKDLDVYKEICQIHEDKLPLHIKDYAEDSPEYFILSCRLKQEDPFKEDLGKCVGLLYNEEFSMGAYKEIGYYDGKAIETSILLDEINMHTEASEAFEAVYACDY